MLPTALARLCRLAPALAPAPLRRCPRTAPGACQLWHIASDAGLPHRAPAGTCRDRPGVPGIASPVSPWGQRRGFLPSLGGVEKRLVERRTVPIAPEQFFEVVADVEHYKEFVPFCVDSSIIKRTSPTEVDAQLCVGFQLFSESYVSRVTLQPPNVVRAEAIGSNIFDRLVSEWRFRPAKGGAGGAGGAEGAMATDVEFMVDFKVSSVLHAAAVDAFFEQVSKQQIAAFEGRCRDLRLKKERTEAAAARRQCAARARAAAAAAKAAEEERKGIELPAAAGPAAKAVAAPVTKAVTEAAVGVEDAGAEEGSAGSELARQYAHLPALQAAFLSEGAAQRLEIRQFENVVTEMRQREAVLGRFLASPLSVAALFEAFDANGDGYVDVAEFVQGVHVITCTDVGEQARILYSQLDENGDGRLSMREVERRLNAQLGSVRRLMPGVLKLTYRRPKGGRANKGGSEVIEIALACETLEILAEQAAQDVRALVEEVLAAGQSGGGGGEGGGGFVTVDEWEAAVRKKPEILHVLTLHGMANMVQWAFASGAVPGTS